MKILIIGGTGLLGNKLFEQARGKFEVHATYHNHIVKNPRFHRLEVTNFKAVRNLIDELSPGAVINTSAFHQVDKCETEMDLAKAVNVDAAVNLAEASAAVGAHYVYISTEYVFDGRKGTAYVEEDEPNPLSYYGETKRAGEKAILGVNGDNMVARTSIIYGWNDTKLNFATWALGELENGREIKIVNDQVGSPTLADNLAEAILKAVDLRKTGVYHMAGSEAIDRYRFTLLLADVFGLDKSLIKPISTPELKQKARRPLYAPLDVSKTERELGVKMLSAREGLEKMKAQR